MEFERAEDYKNQLIETIEKIKIADQKPGIERYHLFFNVLEDSIEQLLSMCETFDTEYTRVYEICKEVAEALEEKDSTLYNEVLDRGYSLVLDYVAQEEEYHQEE